MDCHQYLPLKCGDIIFRFDGTRCLFVMSGSLRMIFVFHRNGMLWGVTGIVNALYDRLFARQQVGTAIMAKISSGLFC